MQNRHSIIKLFGQQNQPNGLKKENEGTV